MSDQGESRGNATDYSNPENRKPPKLTDKDFKEGSEKLNIILQRSPNAKGLAIIVGIPYVDGTDYDVANVKSAFEQLGFAVWNEDLPTLETICQMVQSAAKYKGYSTSCRCIVFYFAGHGGSHDGHAFVKPYILPDETVTEAETKLFIKEGIVDPFKPHKELYRQNDRYRLFFFDCCLSDPIASRDTKAPGRRPSGNLPAGANTLVAYATSMDYKSKGQDGRGGVWTRTLCKNLTLDLPITLILDITCDEVINEEIIKQGNQAPHYTSSIGILCLKSQKSTWKEFKQVVIAENGVGTKKPGTPSAKRKKMKANGVMKCECGLPVVQRTSQTKRNPGRDFITCPKPKKKRRCDFFEWLDSSVPAGGASTTSKDTAKPSSVSHRKKKAEPTCSACGTLGHTKTSKACSKRQ